MTVWSITMEGLVMQEQRARKILQSLVQGVDPTSGADLQSWRRCCSTRMFSRALLAGVTALEQVSARAHRRAQLPDNVGIAVVGR